jgi:hypothetical protein
MKSKFDALKQFQSWPNEWQRLCAEYWIETGEGEATQVLTFGDKLDATKDLLQPAPKVAARVPSHNQMRYTFSELTEIDSHLSVSRGPMEVARIMYRKYPNQRTKESWAKMSRLVRKFGLQTMLNRSADSEAKQ